MRISDIEVEVTKKRIKNIYLRVSSGKVRVSAPIYMSEQAIHAFVLSRSDWIREKLLKFENQVLIPEPKYISGETHCLWGKPYVLEVCHTKGAGRVEIKADKLVLSVRKHSTIAQKAKVMTEWYRAELKEQLPSLIAKWENVIGVKVDFVGVRNMRTRWGSCNITRKRVWFNLQLAKKPVHCLEYVVVHELVHLLERNHNKIFKGYMDRFLPEWRVLKSQLNGG